MLALMLLFSCGRDENLGPIITVDSAEIGAFPRLVSLLSGEFDLANPGASQYSHEVEFQSQDAGLNVEAYEIYVRYVDNDPDNGDNSTSEILYETYGQSNFSDSELSLKGITVDYAFSEVASRTGVNIDDISPGDFFGFRSVLKLSDGRQFSQDNSESTLLSDAFRAYFNWNVNATCPLANDIFVGDYSIEFIEGPGNPWATGLRVEDVTLELVPGSTTKRQFAGVVIDAFGGFPVTVQMDFVCTTVQWLETGPGVGCGPPNITYASGAPQPQDITNDSEIILEYFEDGGGCGYTNTDIIKLVKK